MKRFILSIGMCIAFLGTSYGQSQIFIEDFESAVNGTDYSTSRPECSDETTDYFALITDGDVSASFTNVQGSKYFAAQDVDGTNCSFSADDVDSLLITGIDISGNTGLELRVMIAEDDDGSNQDWDADTKVEFKYRIDEGAFQNGIAFAATGTNTEPQEDTDFDGTGDGTAVTAAFSQFTESIGSTGDSLAILVIMTKLDAGDEDVAFDNIEIYGTASGSVPSKLAVTTVNGGSSPSTGTDFDVVVQLQDDDDNAISATQDTSVTLSLATGAGALGGTLTGTISSGNNSVTFTGITYDTAESGVSITATNTGGSLTAGTSSTFEVLSAANQLVLVSVPDFVTTDVAFSSFTVEARRSSDSSVDSNYTKSITISIATGTGNIGGTISQSASSGVATFDDITIDAAGDFTIEAADGSLTSSASGTIVVSDPPPVALLISGIFDGPLSGGTPKYVEFVAIDDISDLSIYGFGSSSNGGGTQGEEYTFPAVSVDKGTYIHVTSDSAKFADFFGFNATYVTSGGALFINGNDAIELFQSSSVIDVYGDVNVDGSGQFWDHFDGWGYRKNFTNAATTFNSGSDAGASPNFLIYDDGSTAFEAPASMSTELGEGFGFALYFYNNDSNGSETLPLSLETGGTSPTTDVTVALNSTDISGSYYTLVGNPFDENYDLTNLAGNNDGIQDNIQLWDASTAAGGGGTGSYVTLSVSAGDVVSVWQGFFVEADNSGTAATSLTFESDDKTTSDADSVLFKTIPTKSGDINFTLLSENSIDKAIKLSVRENAEFGFDKFDASKLVPLEAAYATMAFNSNDRMKSVESIPFNLTEEITLPLQPQIVGIDGEFTFAWNGLETVPSEWELILHDYELATSLDMRTANSYVFTAGAQAKRVSNPLSILSGPAAITMKAKAHDNRFGITVRPASVNTEVGESPVAFGLEQNYPNPFNPSTTISYSIQKAGAVNISVYNLMGQKVATLVDETKSAGQHNVRWNAANVSSGMYYYRLEANGQAITRKMTLIK
jgi:hypothetical protein